MRLLTDEGQYQCRSGAGCASYCRLRLFVAGAEAVALHRGGTGHRRFIYYALAALPEA